MDKNVDENNEHKLPLLAKALLLLCMSLFAIKLFQILESEINRYVRMNQVIETDNLKLKPQKE